jgi:hypothetical protein
MQIKKIGVALGAAALLHGCAGTAQRQAAPAPSDISYPSDPADEARQNTANAVAYLNCACLFLEESTPARCAADLPPGMNKIVPVIDTKRRSVDVTVGRWTAHAQDLGSSQGCRLR